MTACSRWMSTMTSTLTSTWTWRRCSRSACRCCRRRKQAGDRRLQLGSGGCPGGDQRPGSLALGDERQVEEQRLLVTLAVHLHADRQTGGAEAGGGRHGGGGGAVWRGGPGGRGGRGFPILAPPSRGGG